MKLTLINEADFDARRWERRALQGDPEASRRLMRARKRAGKLGGIPAKERDRLGSYQQDFDSGRGKRTLLLICRQLFPNDVVVRPEELLELLKSRSARAYFNENWDEVPLHITVSFLVDGEELGYAYWEDGIFMNAYEAMHIDSFDLLLRAGELVRGLRSFRSISFGVKESQRPEFDAPESFPVKSNGQRPGIERRFLDLITHF